MDKRIIRSINEYCTDRKIKTAGLSDIDKISSVHMKAWKKAYKNIFPSSVIENQNLKVFTTKWHTWLTTQSLVNYIMQTENNFSGFISFGPNEIEGVSGDWEIYSIYIDPKYWGQGVGKKLMTACFSILPEKLLLFLARKIL